MAKEEPLPSLSLLTKVVKGRVDIGSGAFFSVIHAKGQSTRRALKVRWEKCDDR